MLHPLPRPCGSSLPPHRHRVSLPAFHCQETTQSGTVIPLGRGGEQEGFVSGPSWIRFPDLLGAGAEPSRFLFIHSRCTSARAQLECHCRDGTRGALPSHAQLTFLGSQLTFPGSHLSSMHGLTQPCVKAHSEQRSPLSAEEESAEQECPEWGFGGNWGVGRARGRCWGCSKLLWQRKGSSGPELDPSQWWWILGAGEKPMVGAA